MKTSSPTGWGFLFLHKSGFCHTSRCMLVLTQGNTADEMVMTLKEKSMLTAPFYLFSCQHLTTKEVLAFVLPSDQSAFPNRFNRFIINTSTVFLNRPAGQWIYKVYEQAGNSNLDPTGLNMVETGKLNLASSSQPVFTKKYSPSTSFKAYAG